MGFNSGFKGLKSISQINGQTEYTSEIFTSTYLKLWTSSTNSQLPAAITAGSSNGLTNINAVDIVVCAPDDGWRDHPKHVGRFPDINKLCNVASCWIYIAIYL